jgi:shikimate kinase
MSAIPTRVFLIGPMGAGKTTLGRQLAQILALDFYDTDHEIQARTGVDVPTIFEFEGEAGFRRRERAVLADLATLPDVVIATGGGIVLDPDNRRLMSESGLVVYLHCLPSQQFQRTRRDRSRPLLQTADPLARLTELFQQRDPLYRSIADLVVSTETRATNAVIRQIVAAVRDPGAAAGAG